MTDVAIQSPVSASSKTPSKPSPVTHKVREAIRLMVNEGKPWDEAAVEAGLTTRAMRMALEKPEVVAFLRKQKYVFREQASASNILRLTQIRDAADNMPAVNAIKELEAMGQDEAVRARGGGSVSAPGFTIQLIQHVTGAPAPVTIEHKADE